MSSSDDSLTPLIERTRQAVMWSPVFSTVAAFVIWFVFHWAIDRDYNIGLDIFSLLCTLGILIVVLGIHLRIWFLSRCIHDTVEASTLFRLQRAARLVLLLPLGSFLVFSVAAFIGLIYWFKNDVSQFPPEAAGWAFMVVFLFIAVIHAGMLVLVYLFCAQTIRLFYFVQKELEAHPRGVIGGGVISGWFDAVCLGLSLFLLGVTFYYLVPIYNARYTEHTEPNFRAFSFLDENRILGSTFEDELAVFDMTTKTTDILASGVILSDPCSFLNRTSWDFYIRQKMINRGSCVMFLHENLLTLEKIALDTKESSRITFDKRVAVFDVDPQGRWVLACHETGKVSLTKCPEHPDEKPGTRWIDVPEIRMDKRDKPSDEAVYFFPFDTAFLLPSASETGEPDIGFVSQEGIYSVFAAPDYDEKIRVDLSFPGEKTNIRSLGFLSPDSNSVVISVERSGRDSRARLALFDARTGEMRFEFPDMEHYMAFTLSSDGRYAITTSFSPYPEGATATVWDIGEKKKLTQRSLWHSWRLFTFSPDMRFAATVDGGKIRTYTFPQMKPRQAIPVPRIIDSTAPGFSPDGQRIFVNQYEGCRVLKFKE